MTKTAQRTKTAAKSNVIRFPSPLSQIYLPKHVDDDDGGTVKMRSTSLTDRGIYDGDLIIYRRRFAFSGLAAPALSVVRLNGHLTVGTIIRGKGQDVTIRYYSDQHADEYARWNEMEILGLVIGFQRYL